MVIKHRCFIHAGLSSWQPILRLIFAIRSMSQPFKLLRLQQVDSQLDQARSRLNEIEASLSDHAALRQAQEEARQVESALEEARKSLRHAEQEVQAQHIKMEQSEASLYGGKIRNPKELQDLQKEIASIKRFITVLEDRQLDLMLAVEETEAGYSAAQQALETVRAQAAVQQDALLEEQKGLLQRVEGLEADRQAVAGSIDKEDMQLYEELRRQRRGVAVARVADNACAACGSILTPGQVQAAHSLSLISRCGFCGRILYAG
jgi:predicted  nucleic acid-binding Zn-ribbon protein